VLGLTDSLTDLRRVDLQTNYRCPPMVVERAVRLIEHNLERFAKSIRAGPAATGPLVLAADAGEDVDRIRRVLSRWPADASTRAVLARTNRELLPAVVVALDLGLPFRAPSIPLPLESQAVDDLLVRIGQETSPALPLPVRIGLVARSFPAPDTDDEDAGEPGRLARTLLAWAVPYHDLAHLAAAIAERRSRLAMLRRDDAALTLATAHGTKGLEFDHVAVLGMDAGRFPSRRSIEDAPEPARAIEEERRLAYVAWTRARRSLTLMYDPEAPSPFLLEAFSPAELGVATIRG
jgi:superfamily I DNA/RNA helicase